AAAPARAAIIARAFVTVGAHRRAIAIAPLALFAAFREALVLRHRIVLEDFALVDPHLHADAALGRVGFGEAVIDIRAQRVQRHRALLVPFHPRDFRAAETAGNVDADALAAKAHGRLHGALHGAAERDAALKLLGDAFGDQRGVDLRLAHFDE